MLPSTVDYIKFLVLLPSSHNKLQMQWKGPYSVLKRHDNGVDYLIKARGKVELYHINMLKEYVRRGEKPKAKVSVCQVCIIDDSVCANDVCDISLLDEAVENKLNISPQSFTEQVTDLEKLVSKFQGVFR